MRDTGGPGTRSLEAAQLGSAGATFFLTLNLNLPSRPLHPHPPPLPELCPQGPHMRCVLASWQRPVPSPLGPLGPAPARATQNREERDRSVLGGLLWFSESIASGGADFIRYPMAKPSGTCVDILGTKVEGLTFVLFHFVLLRLSRLVECFEIPSEPTVPWTR